MEKQDYFIYLVIAFIFYLVCNNTFNAPVSTSDTPQNKEMAKLFKYENLKDPEQSAFYNLNNESLIFEKKDYKIRLYPQANYRIYAMVMSKNRYRFGWEGEIVPYDLALGWNELMLPQNQVGISYTQSNRWYYYDYNEKFPLSPFYIPTHSSNHHIIPANRNVFKAINKVRNKEKIYMEGYLVNISGTVGKGTVQRNSSLTRNDTGAGACEVFYVKKAVLNGKIYD